MIKQYEMRIINLVILIIPLISCQQRSGLDYVAEKNSELKEYIDSLNSTPFIYKKCEECGFTGLSGDKLIGYADRYSPDGLYDKKEL